VYRKIGDKIYPLIGQIHEKERAMLEERIKRAGRLPPSDLHNTSTNPGDLTHKLNSTILSGTPAPRGRSASRFVLLIFTIFYFMKLRDRRTIGVSSHTHVHEEPPHSETTRRSMAPSMSSGNINRLNSSRFQLDSKFFANDFDDMPHSSNLNRTFTMQPPVSNGTRDSASLSDILANPIVIHNMVFLLTLIFLEAHGCNASNQYFFSQKRVSEFYIIVGKF
jgi:hypothetical protein